MQFLTLNQPFWIKIDQFRQKWRFFDPYSTIFESKLTNFDKKMAFFDPYSTIFESKLTNFNKNGAFSIRIRPFLNQNWPISTWIALFRSVFDHFWIKIDQFRQKWRFFRFGFDHFWIKIDHFCHFKTAFQIFIQKFRNKRDLRNHGNNLPNIFSILLNTVASFVYSSIHNNNKNNLHFRQF